MGVIEPRKSKKKIHVTICVCSGNPAGGFPERKMKSNVANCHPNLSPALVAYWINTNTFRHLWSIEKLPAILSIFPGMLTLGLSIFVTVEVINRESAPIIGANQWISPETICFQALSSISLVLSLSSQSFLKRLPWRFGCPVQIFTTEAESCSSGQAFLTQPFS